MKKVSFKRRMIGGVATAKEIREHGAFKATFGFNMDHPLFKAVGWKRKKKNG